MTSRFESSRALALCSLALVACLSFAARPQRLCAQASLIDGLGGVAGFGVGEVPIGDDMEATRTVDITSAFPAGLEFFGVTYDAIHVNTNGNVTFVSRFGTFTPTAFPGAPQPVIAPWWGDGDTRGVLSEPAGANRVYYAVEPGRVVVTWYLLGYYASHVDLLNSFQLVITPPRMPQPEDPPGAFDVEFRYHRCEWTTGDASDGTGGFGGVPALAGLDGGDGLNFVTLPGSLTMRVLELCATSNVEDPGVWRFSPRGNAIEATCGNGFRETGEACDDGNTVDGDGCSARCRVEVPPACGDGRRDAGEECDDGNTRAGDGCGADCLLELGPCDAVPASRDAAARPDASCNDAGPPDASIDAGVNVPLLEGGGCACFIGARSAPGAAGLLPWGVTSGLVLAAALRRRRRARPDVAVPEGCP